MELVLGAAVVIGAPDLVTIARSLPRPRPGAAWPLLVTVAVVHVALVVAALRWGA